MKKFFSSRGGTAGAVLLGLLLLTGLAGPILVPFPGADSHWRDLSFWKDNPAAAPPVWTTGPWDTVPRTENRILTGSPAGLEALEGGATKLWWNFTLDSQLSGPVVVLVDGEGSFPVLVSSWEANAIPQERDRRLVEPSAGQPARISLVLSAADHVSVTEIRSAGTPVPLPPRMVVVGQVSGLLGTDTAKRDVFTGVVLGVRWALILGLGVSFLTVVMGLGLGILAACSGGWVDTLLNRVYEFFSLMPLLPLLIVLSAVYKPSLWTFLALGLLFFWTKAFKPVYAMALQIRHEGYIEAGRSLGASRWRLATRHVLPALLPYGFAVMALSVPRIILYEASVSLLGLGDSSAVTWGQMLHDAFVQGAVIGRLWWWILPPGSMITLTGLTFALLGRGFDKVWKAKN